MARGSNLQRHLDQQAGAVLESHGVHVRDGFSPTSDADDADVVRNALGADVEFGADGSCTATAYDADGNPVSATERGNQVGSRLVSAAGWALVILLVVGGAAIPYT